MSEIQPSNTAELAQYMGVDVTAQLDELLDVGLASLNSAMFHTARAGVAFALARERFKLDVTEQERDDHGQFHRCADVRTTVEFSSSTVSADVRTNGFDAWMAANGVAKERVYEAIRIAEFIAALPDANRAKALQMGKSKALLLARLEPEAIAEVVETGEFDELSELSVREMRDYIRKLQRHVADDDHQIAVQRLQIESIDNYNRSLTNEPNTQLADATIRARKICAAMTANIQESIIHLVTVREAAIHQPQPNNENDIQLQALRLAIYAAKASVDELAASLGDHLPPELVDLYNHKEAQSWQIDYKMVQNQVLDIANSIALQLPKKPRAGRSRKYHKE